jgi:hypothetical protein
MKVLPGQHQKLMLQKARQQSFGNTFLASPIDLDKEMEDVEEIDGTSTQLENSWQPNILPILLPTL